MRIIVDRCDLQPAVLSILFADFYDVWLAMLDYLEARLFINHILHFLTNVPFLLGYNHGRIINIFFVEAAYVFIITVLFMRIHVNKNYKRKIAKKYRLDL